MMAQVRGHALQRGQAGSNVRRDGSQRPPSALRRTTRRRRRRSERGNPQPVAQHALDGGSIPAGKPCARRTTYRSIWVHPRVGGETNRHRNRPPVRPGPSPRGRGNRARPGQLHVQPGSIPAWAGKPMIGSPSTIPTTVHPRVGGETDSENPAGGVKVGPSPRGRGNHRLVQHQVLILGSIPAWAGKPSATSSSQVSCRVHPRVGGETARLRRCRSTPRGPSPRGRGNRSVHPARAR